MRAPQRCDRGSLMIKVCCGMLLLLLSGTSMGADRKWITYDRLLEITRLDKFYAAPLAERDKVRILGTVKPNNPRRASFSPW